MTLNPARDIDPDLRQAIEDFFAALRTLWSDPNFQPSDLRRGHGQDREAVTTASADAHLLPVTKRPIRGTDGVESGTRERAPLPTEVVRHYLSESVSTWNKTPTASECRDHFQQVLSEIDKDHPLGYRLLGSVGYKHYSPEDFESRRSEGGSDRFDYWSGLMHVFARGITSASGLPASPLQFENWETAKNECVEELRDLRARSQYSYQVRIYLSGPAVDSAADIPIANLGFDGGATQHPISVTLAYATDELLQPLISSEVLNGLQKVNTVLRYDTTVGVELGEDAYLGLYADAANVAELVVNGLRLLRYQDDIGVLALEIVGDDEFTPHIRKTWADRYQHELARFQPQRFDFGPPAIEPLDQEEISRLRRAVSSILGNNGRFRGLQYALSRLSRSIERYAPNDHERLLDYAIALEALFLNDISPDRSELTYRLRVRVARYLAEAYDERSQIFQTVGNLYKYRSTIAHGGSLATQSARDNEKLSEVLERVPGMLSDSILRLLESPSGSIPSGDTTEFWRRVELER